MKRLVAILALVATLLAVGSIAARAKPPTVRAVCPAGHVQKCRDEIVRLRAAIAWHRQRAVARWPGDGAAAIILACHTRHETAARCAEAFTVARCESHLNPLAKNRSSTASGLFQFLSSTWARQGYPAFSVFDPYLNAMG